MGVDEDDIHFYSGWHCRNPFGFEWHVQGPNAKNNAKLLFLREKKQHCPHQFQVTLLEEVDGRKCLTFIVRVVPTPEHAIALALQTRAEETEHREDESWYSHYKRISERRTRRYKPVIGLHFGEPVLELDEYPEEAEYPFPQRKRHQRGWGDIYRPTRDRRYARDDRKNWKRTRKTQWQST